MSYLYLIQWPLLTLVRWFFFFVPAVNKRFSFEAKNRTEIGARSFREAQQKADLCFEFSSEGEFQQVASLIDDALRAGKRIELVFFSPSVEKTVLELQAKNPTQIRYLRYPLRGIAFSRWATADHLILVRYDLFPEFLIWARTPGRRLSFLWITFKKERLAGKSISWLKRRVLSLASHRIYASAADLQEGERLGFPGVCYDFRMEQIHRRLLGREEKFQRQFKFYPQLKQGWERFPRNKRLLMGNAWPVDLKLLKNFPSDVFVLIVPHQLSQEVFSQMHQELNRLNMKASLITDSLDGGGEGRIFILNKKGVLCELYADFGKAYVGGGFGVSVHSLLEPLVAGSEAICCGPVHHRSTEFDLAVEAGRAKEVKNAQEFLEWLQDHGSGGSAHDKLKAQLDAYPVFAKDVLSC